MNDEEVDTMREWMLDECGQAMTEYALIIGVLVLMVIVPISLTSTAIGDLYDKIVDAVTRATSP